MAAGLLGCTGAVTEGPAIRVEIAPGFARVSPNGTVAFTAAVARAAEPSVQWNLAEARAGAITSAGLYTAPPREGVFHLVARSVADPSAMAEVAIEVASPDAGGSWPVEESSGSRSIADEGANGAPAGNSTDETAASNSGGLASGEIATQSVYREAAVGIAISPRTPSVVAGSSISFSASVTGTSNTAVAWSLQEASGCGSVTTSGVYTAPAVSGTCHVVATSRADPSMSDVATVSVTPRTPVAVAVAVVPYVASVAVSGTLSFSAVVTGTSNTAVSWSVREASGCGTVTQAGIYTAPAGPATCHVVAKSIADPSKSNLATVTVATKPAVTVAVSPRSAALQGGDTTSFRAVVTGTSNTGVSWSVLTSPGCGSVTQDGVYTAPVTARTCYVFVRSKADSSKTDYAPITVKVPIAISVAPHTATVSTGGAVSFSATVTGTTNTAVSWSVQESSGCGTVTQAGVYTAPTAPRTCHVVVRSQADSSKSDTATVTVTAPIAVSVAPHTASVSAGGTVTFTAAVTGTSNTGVTWSVQESSGCGTVTQAGVYTAPAAAATCHVVARSQADTSKSDTATITVSAPIAVSVAPHTASVSAGGTVTFTAAVTGTSNTGVTWSVQESSGCGTVTQAGVYTAPAAAATCHVVARSQADTSKSDTATITVSAPIAVSVAPHTASVAAGGTVAFTAAVTGTSNTGVTWSVQESSGCGTVTQAGVYTAPAAAATCHVVARSNADSSKSDAATVTVTAAPIVVTLQPASASVFSCQSTTFKATVSGTSNSAVTWSVQEGAAGGSITTGGTYTAPSVAGTYHVVATSQADPSKSAAGPVTVADKVLSVTVNPPQITIPAGGTASFTATITTTCGTTTEKQIITAD
jgi:hypothetical protein